MVPIIDPSASGTAEPLQLLKLDRGLELDNLIVSFLDDEESFEGIRCPLCLWRPSASSLWCCASTGTPEPFVGGCGTSWNTFATRGRCPGCSHQWQWTSCLRCAAWSLHEDWYERDATAGRP
jgi:hypothetical protein